MIRRKFITLTFIREEKSQIYYLSFHLKKQKKKKKTKLNPKQVEDRKE